MLCTFAKSFHPVGRRSTSVCGKCSLCGFPRGWLSHSVYIPLYVNICAQNSIRFAELGPPELGIEGVTPIHSILSAPDHHRCWTSLPL